MKFGIIVQARSGSARLPNKVLRSLDDKYLVFTLLIKRLLKIYNPCEVVLATTVDPSDDLLTEVATDLGIGVVRGSQNDVLSRFIDAAQKYDFDFVARITGDCPFTDPCLIEAAEKMFLSKKVDYLSNTLIPTFPDGLDIEIFSLDALIESSNLAVCAYDREHVTPRLKSDERFKKHSWQADEDNSAYRLTVDEPEDLEFCKRFLGRIEDKEGFSYSDMVQILRETPDLVAINKHLIRNEGGSLNTGQKLWRRAERAIAGGNSLLSKRPDMLLPGRWPTYFTRAHGVDVYDLDGTRYFDVGLMGVGTNILGYANQGVDDAVKAAISKGTMSSLNCVEEVELAEKMIQLHPWASQVKFARTGGEVNAVALRIARAATGKSGVAFCGYHGWHDWYLATNIESEDALNGHLLKGLSPVGVPSELTGTANGFRFNQVDDLISLLKNPAIGTIIMEVQRDSAPRPDFLEKVRTLADEHKCILIFDECTSGFRQNFGGIHLTYGVTPDLATFGKALGNGYPITCVIGTQEVMDYAQDTFISSTFWSDRIGPVAALKALELMEAEKSWEKITDTGRRVKEGWMRIFEAEGLRMRVGGLDAIATFSNVDVKLNAHIKTYVSQEMLEKGYLATNAFYASTAHTENIVDEYLDQFHRVIKALQSRLNEGDPWSAILRGDVCRTSFTRIT